MRKLYFSLLGICAVTLVYLFFFYETCVQPSTEDINIVKLGCMIQLIETLQTNPTPILDEICKAKGEDFGCEIVEGKDDAAVEKVLSGRVKRCTIGQLKANNLCTDKVK
jgi:hypothetical protein